MLAIWVPEAVPPPSPHSDHEQIRFRIHFRSPFFRFCYLFIFSRIRSRHAEKQVAAYVLIARDNKDGLLFTSASNNGAHKNSNDLLLAVCVSRVPVLPALQAWARIKHKQFVISFLCHQVPIPLALHKAVRIKQQRLVISCLCRHGSCIASAPIDGAKKQQGFVNSCLCLPARYC